MTRKTIKKIVLVDNNSNAGRGEMIVKAWKKCCNNVEILSFAEVSNVPHELLSDPCIMHVAHANNEDALPYIGKACINVPAILYTGGNKVSVARFCKDNDGTCLNISLLRSPPMLLGVTYVTAENVSKLIASIQFMLSIHEDKMVEASVLLPSPFEKRRCDLSHDRFKNAFCNAFSYAASNAIRADRNRLFLRAARQREYWMKLKRIALKWPKIANDIKRLMEDARSEACFAYPTETYVELCSKAELHMQFITELMEKFSGDNYRQSQLCESEIESFWQATDTICELFAALRSDGAKPASKQHFADPQSVASKTG